VYLDVTFKSFTKEINNISTLGTETTIHTVEIVFIRGRTILHGVVVLFETLHLYKKGICYY
jgi:hypothetical protein